MYSQTDDKIASGYLEEKNPTKKKCFTPVLVQRNNKKSHEEKKTLFLYCFI